MNISTEKKEGAGGEDFAGELCRRTGEVERIISAYLPEPEGPQKKVIEAMRYAFLSGGKRIRPILMLETYRLFACGERRAMGEAAAGGGERERSDIPAVGGDVIHAFMAAVEMIHCYSLIHDDLPAMDDDDYRRGRPATHVAYGEAVGILAGDALLNLAFETAACALLGDESAGSAHAADEGKIGTQICGRDIAAARALRLLAASSGVFGMIGGQTADIEAEQRDAGAGVSAGMAANTDLSEVEFIYRHKTGDLIEASMRIGAVLAGADAEDEEKIAAVGRDVGMAFQIRDDILDIEGDESVTGKPAGSDEKNQKKTYVSLKGIEESRRDAKEYSGRAISALRSLGRETLFLERLILSLAQRER